MIKYYIFTLFGWWRFKSWTKVSSKVMIDNLFFINKLSLGNTEMKKHHVTEDSSCHFSFLVGKMKMSHSGELQVVGLLTHPVHPAHSSLASLKNLDSEPFFTLADHTRAHVHTVQKHTRLVMWLCTLRGWVPPCLVHHGSVHDITLSSVSLKAGNSFRGILDGIPWEVLEGRIEMAR